jgi:aspartyl-tRNA synthetase
MADFTKASVALLPQELSGMSYRKASKSTSFFTLSDNTGDVQLIAQGDAAHALSEAPLESVVSIKGTVVERPASARRDVSYQTATVAF